MSVFTKNLTADGVIAKRATEGRPSGALTKLSDLIMVETAGAASTFTIRTDTEIIDGSGNTITFAENTPSADTITRASGDWRDSFRVGDNITIVDSSSNDGTYEITALTATILTVHVSDDDLAAESFTSGDLTITGADASILMGVMTIGANDILALSDIQNLQSAIGKNLFFHETSGAISAWFAGKEDQYSK